MKTFLFDFDGTLADTQTPILKTLKSSLQKLGVRAPEDAELMPLIGLPLKEIFSRTAKNADPVFLDEAVRIYRNDFFDHCQDKLALYPDVRETLANLQKGGHVLTISSSRNKPSLNRLVEMLDIGKYFTLIAGEEDVVKHKPDAELADFILNRIGAPRKSAIVVGDTLYDIGMGKAAKLKTCAVTYGNQKREIMETARPDWLIDRFSELEKISRIDNL